LVLEAFEDGGVLGDLGLEDFDGEDLAGLAVAGFIDDAYAAAAELAENLVAVGEGCGRANGRHEGRFGVGIGGLRHVGLSLLPGWGGGGFDQSRNIDHIRNVWFECDERKNESNQKKHRVSFETAKVYEKGIL